MSLVVATLSGCGEDAKDCGGFWDKTFGREECAVATPQNTTTPIIQTPVISTISPSQPTVGEQTTFTLTGQHLTNDLQLALADCDNLQITSRSSSQIVFGCKPAVKGLHKVELKQNTNVIADFSLEFQQTGEILRVKESKAEDVVQNSLGMDVVKGQLVVIAKDGVTPEQVAALAQKYNMKIVGQVDLVNMYQLEGQLTLDELNTTLSSIKEELIVDSANYNLFSQSAFSEPYIPNDSRYNTYSGEWTYNSRTWSLKAAKVPQAWSSLRASIDNYVNVGLVDSGFRKDHEDMPLLDAQLYGIKGPDDYEPDRKESSDTRNHGMHVAGIMSAFRDNLTGISGISSPNITFAYGTDFSTMGAMAGIAWLASKNVKVINLSLGNRLTQNTIDNAHKVVASERRQFAYFFNNILKHKDVLIVQAAGNRSKCTEDIEYFCKDKMVLADLSGYGASLKSKINQDDLVSLRKEIDIDRLSKNILVVGALQPKDDDVDNFDVLEPASYTQGGGVVDIMAPGGGTSTIFPSKIYSLGHAEKDYYWDARGTSQAAPYVSGVAALAWKANIKLSASQVRGIIVSSYDVTTKDYNGGSYDVPILNADLIVKQAMATNPEKVNLSENEQPFGLVAIRLFCSLSHNNDVSYELNAANVDVYTVIEGQEDKKVDYSPTLANIESVFLLPANKKFKFKIVKGTTSPVELESRPFLVAENKSTSYAIYTQDDVKGCNGNFTKDNQRYQLWLQTGFDAQGKQLFEVAPQSIGDTTPSITTTPASPIINTETSFSLVDSVFDGIKSIIWKFGQEIVEVFDNFGNAIKHIFNTLGEATVSATLKDQTGKEVATVSTKVVVIAAVCPEGQIEKDGKCVEPQPTDLLNDTGITQCSNENTLLGACSAANLGGWFGLNQDGEVGRDFFAVNGKLTKIGGGDAGFDFTKISATGEKLPANATEWSCVLDNHTGLMWEVETDDGGLRDKDNRYAWYNPDTSTNGGTVGYQYGGSNTQAFSQAVNAQALCGYTNWRLPTKQELHSIVNYGKLSPTIDTAYFPNTQSYYWSSTPFADHDNPDFGNAVWVFYFRYGYDAIITPNNSSGLNVRLVRSGQ